MPFGIVYPGETFQSGGIFQEFSFVGIERTHGVHRLLGLLGGEPTLPQSLIGVVVFALVAGAVVLGNEQVGVAFVVEVGIIIGRLEGGVDDEPEQIG